MERFHADEPPQLEGHEASQAQSVHLESPPPEPAVNLIRRWLCGAAGETVLIELAGDMPLLHLHPRRYEGWDGPLM